MAKKTAKSGKKKTSAKPERLWNLKPGPYVIPRGKPGCEVTVRFVIPRAKGCDV